MSSSSGLIEKVGGVGLLNIPCEAISHAELHIIRLPLLIKEWLKGGGLLPPKNGVS